TEPSISRTALPHSSSAGLVALHVHDCGNQRGRSATQRMGRAAGSLWSTRRAGEGRVSRPFSLRSRGAEEAWWSVAVIGVGGLGLHAVQVAKLAGAAPVIAVDSRSIQLERSARAGAD